MIPILRVLECFRVFSLLDGTMNLLALDLSHVFDLVHWFSADFFLKGEFYSRSLFHLHVILHLCLLFEFGYQLSCSSLWTFYCFPTCLYRYFIASASHLTTSNLIQGICPWMVLSSSPMESLIVYEKQVAPFILLREKSFFLPKIYCC